MKIATCQHCKGPIVECGGRSFAMVYECECGNTWDGDWCCACNDECQLCHSEIEPSSWQEVTDEVNQFNEYGEIQ